jgi:mono/diheme cytochrome c family protein
MTPPPNLLSHQVHRAPALRSVSLLAGCVFAAAGLSAADATRGQATFATYCGACHGPEGAGLVGPNLTDSVFIHGGTRADIVRTLMNGVGDKGMPAWGAILPPADIEAVADFTVSLIGKNLKSPFAPGESSVTAFPKGSAAFPLLMRTFMPTMGVEPAVFAHHQHGQVAAKYNPEKASDVEGIEKPIDGVPSAIVVNFGDALSYCFDTTECRLLYTWNGPFMDMTRYWGAAAGGGRKSKDYVPVVNGPVWWRTSGSVPLQVPGETASAPRFTGYRKVQQVPVLLWRMGEVQVALRITPGAKPGEAVCRYTTVGATKGLSFALPADSAAQITADKGTRTGTMLSFNTAEAAQFTITIAPGEKPLVEAPKPEKTKDASKPGKPKVEEKE